MKNHKSQQFTHLSNFHNFRNVVVRGSSRNDGDPKVHIAKRGKILALRAAFFRSSVPEFVRTQVAPGEGPWATRAAVSLDKGHIGYAGRFHVMPQRMCMCCQWIWENLRRHQNAAKHAQSQPPPAAFVLNWQHEIVTTSVVTTGPCCVGMHSPR